MKTYLDSVSHPRDFLAPVRVSTGGLPHDLPPHQTTQWQGQRAQPGQHQPRQQYMRPPPVPRPQHGLHHSGFHGEGVAAKGGGGGPGIGARGGKRLSATPEAVAAAVAVATAASFPTGAGERTQVARNGSFDGGLMGDVYSTGGLDASASMGDGRDAIASTGDLYADAGYPAASAENIGAGDAGNGGTRGGGHQVGRCRWARGWSVSPVSRESCTL